MPVLHDSDIREPLFDFLEDRYGKIRILEEKRTGRARADMVMVTPALLFGIEIKSDADTYARLKRQVQYYDQFYDRNIIVAGSTHAERVHEHVPAWWGIISAEWMDEGNVSAGVDFYVLREAAENPRVKSENKIRILWRPELNHLLEINHLPAYSRKSKEFVQKKCLEQIPEEILWPQAMEELFERDYDKVLEEIDQYRQQHRKHMK